MEEKLSEADQCRPETIGLRQLSAEISLGLRSPVTIRAGEVSGGRPRKQLSKMYAYLRTHNMVNVRKQIRVKKPERSSG